MITTILIDDEINALETLEWQIKTYCSHIKILKKVTSSAEAISEVKRLNPDCIFLDIKMPCLSGFDVLKYLKNQSFKTIFTTAHDEYAIKAIKASAFDYLLKPIDKDDLIDTVSKLSLVINGDEKNTLFDPHKKIPIQVDGSIHFYDNNEIIFLKAESNYTTIFLTNNRKVTLCKTLKEVEKSFSQPTFFRIHKSYLINLNHVQEYMKCEGGSVLMSNGKYTGISRSKKNLFFDLMH